MRRQLEWLRYIDFCYLAKRVGSQVGGFLSMISIAKGLSKLTLIGSSDWRYEKHISTS
jgi:hypothetical protein